MTQRGGTPLLCPVPAWPVCKYSVLFRPPPPTPPTPFATPFFWCAPGRFAVARSSTLTLAAVWRLETRLKLCLNLTRHHGRAARSKSPRSPHCICCRGAPGARGSRRTSTSAHVERRAARLVPMARRASAGIVATARRTAGARELPESRTAPRQPSISHQRPSPHAAAPRTALAPIPVDASRVTGARSTATPTLTRTSSSAPQSRRTAETVRNRCGAGASLAAVGTPTATRCD